LRCAALIVTTGGLADDGAYAPTMAPSNTDVDQLIASASQPLQALVAHLRATMRRLLPDAVEELDPSATLIGYTYQPGTYKGLIAAIAPHAAHVNLMFSRGVELLDHDPTGLLEGTGKKARHIKLTEPAQVDDDVHQLILEAARRTPRP